MNSSTPTDGYRVAALYKFAPLAEFRAMRDSLLAICRGLGIRGTLLLAHEGINGTVAGRGACVAELVAWLEARPDIGKLRIKYSQADEMPFHRMKVRLKKEIVTLGVEGLDPVTQAGTRVSAVDWNALIESPETVVVDTRNDYEVALGTFPAAIDPGTPSFSEFPAWLEANRESLKGRKVAMFCTGGIRCEKATSLLRQAGLEEVYHLDGGILKYLEDVPSDQSLWQGECFVFDERVSVTKGLQRGEARLCRACRRPLTPEQQASPHFVEGVSCPHCKDKRSAEDRARYAERQRQVELAARRNAGPHIGG